MNCDCDICSLEAAYEKQMAERELKKEPMYPTATVAAFSRISPTTATAIAALGVPSMTEMVQEFHNHFGVKEDHKMDSISLVNLRHDLIDEEVSELGEALFDGKVPDKVAAADALGDIIYVAIGAALAWGIDIERVFAEIHRSNMTKSLTDRGDGGKMPLGKIMKGADYSPPDLSFVNEPNS